MLAIVPPRGQGDSLERDGALERNFQRSLLHGIPIPIRSHVRAGGHRVAEVPLDLRYAMIRREQPLAQQPLQDAPHARPMDELQDEQVRLQRKHR